MRDIVANAPNPQTSMAAVAIDWGLIINILIEQGEEGELLMVYRFLPPGHPPLLPNTICQDLRGHTQKRKAAKAFMKTSYMHGLDDLKFKLATNC
jgi:hypothetical protein